MWTNPDLDVFTNYEQTIPENHGKVIYFMLENEPSVAAHLLHKAIMEANPTPVANLMSKFMCDPTINLIPDEETIGWTLYMLNEQHYYLHIPRWRQMVQPSESHNEWIMTYPLVSAFCKWAQQMGFTSIRSLSCQAIHNYVEYSFCELEEGEVSIYDHGKEQFVAGETNVETDDDFLMTPLEYLIPKVFSMMGNEGLSVLAGSIGLGALDSKAAQTLGAHLEQQTDFTPIFEHLDEWITEIEESSDAPSETFISKVDDRSNNGVMFG